MSTPASASFLQSVAGLLVASSALLPPAPWDKLPKGVDALLAPAKMTREERAVKSNVFAEAVLAPQAADVVFAALPTTGLQHLLIVEKPRVVEEHRVRAANVASLTSLIKAPAQGEGAKKKRQGGAKGAKRGHSSLIQAYSGEEAGAKRARTDGDDDAPDPSAYYNAFDDDAKIASQLERRVPLNLYEVLDAAFLFIWDQDIADLSAKAAFFAKITSANCTDYGLAAFSEHSFSLPVIKQKLAGREYVNYDEFIMDFNLLFGNIFTYYPPQHVAYAKALEMRNLLDEKWTALAATFKY